MVISKDTQDLRPPTTKTESTSRSDQATSSGKKLHKTVQTTLLSIFVIGSLLTGWSQPATAACCSVSSTTGPWAWEYCWCDDDQIFQCYWQHRQTVYSLGCAPFLCLGIHLDCGQSTYQYDDEIASKQCQEGCPAPCGPSDGTWSSGTLICDNSSNGGNCRLCP